MTVSKQDRCEFLDSVRDLIAKRLLAQALERLKNYILLQPLDPQSFEMLSEVLFQSGKLEAAQAAERRFKQLAQIASNSKPAKMADQYAAVAANTANTADLIELDGYAFAGLRSYQKAEQIYFVGASIDGRAFLKMEITSPESVQSISDESKTLKHLSDNHCVSCPQLLSAGSIRTTQLNAAVFSALDSPKMGKLSVKDEFCYVISEYARADRGGFALGDIVLALLEQQALGIYHNDISLERIRFDSLLGICRFTDYRRALLLDESLRSMPARDYINWCLKREEERLLQGGSDSFFTGREAELNQLFDNDRFLLVRSRMFGRQRIADMPDSFIQDVDVGTCYLNGTASVVERTGCFDDLEVSQGEQILDLGCGAGGISRYFARRGSRVTAIDCDDQLIEQTRLLANLSGLRMTADTCDLEHEFPSGEFDTVLALGVLSSVTKSETLAERIAITCCKRVLLECSLNEKSYRWQGSEYHEVDKEWEFDSLDHLEDYIRYLFPSFAISCIQLLSSGRSLFLLTRTNKNYGSSDGAR